MTGDAMPLCVASLRSRSGCSRCACRLAFAGLAWERRTLGWGPRRGVAQERWSSANTIQS